MSDFAERVLAWHSVHGRHDLPWQQNRTAYRVWLSEVMLQQTTVAAVIGYYQRFLARFPDLASLAAADLDEVLSLWQGLGYYARARNLHACARAIVDDYGGTFPQCRSELETLPGIGRSTAAAICAQTWGQAEAILDANVRRLLVRHLGVREWAGKSAVQKRLWQTAESRLPKTELANYTQGVMDLGAHICTARNPKCGECPVNEDCIGLKESITDIIPKPAPKKSKRPHRYCYMWVHHNDAGHLLLHKRPPVGIWGGLWCLPQSELTESPLRGSDLPKLKHSFSHFDLTILPQMGAPPADATHRVAEAHDEQWVAAHRLPTFGLPTAIHRILATLPT